MHLLYGNARKTGKSILKRIKLYADQFQSKRFCSHSFHLNKTVQEKIGPSEQWISTLFAHGLSFSINIRWTTVLC